MPKEITSALFACLYCRYHRQNCIHHFSGAYLTADYLGDLGDLFQITQI